MKDEQQYHDNNENKNNNVRLTQSLRMIDNYDIHI